MAGGFVLGEFASIDGCGDTGNAEELDEFSPVGTLTGAGNPASGFS